MAESAIVTVLGCKTVSGKAARGFATGPLGSALVERWGCDAMLQCGFAPDGRRITRSSPLPITMTCVGFDLDPPGHQADEAWSSDVEAKLGALVAHHGGYAYSTRSGWRWVVQLAAPILLHMGEDWNAWRARYAAACDWLAMLGLTADRSCSEPGRLFRLADVMRDGVRIEPSVIGSAERLGAFELPEAPTLVKPEESTRNSVPAVAPPAPRDTAGDDVVCAPSGEQWGLLLERSLVVGPCPRGGWIIHCPNTAAHSTGKPGDGSTVYYPPSEARGTFGAIHCKHAACQGVEHSDWIALLEGPKRHQRSVRIVAAREDDECQIVRLEIVATDGKGPIYPPKAGWPAPRPGPAVLTVAIARSWGSKAVRNRYAQLWECAGITPPKDFDPSGDLGGAIDELRGRELTLELGADGKVRRILPARTSEAA